MKIEQFPLVRHKDHRGYLEEIFKPEMLPEDHREFGQCFLTTAKPGITKGNHWHHHNKYELFYMVKGEATLYFKDLDSNEVLELAMNESDPKVIQIPPDHFMQSKILVPKISIFWSIPIRNQWS